MTTAMRSAVLMPTAVTVFPLLLMLKMVLI